MSTLSPDQKSWILDLSRSIVGRLAPEESALFAVYEATFLQDPDAFDLALKSRSDRDALSFAGQEVAEFAVASIVLPLVKEVVAAIYQRRQLRRTSAGLLLTRDDLEFIRTQAYAMGRKTLLSGEQAAELSNSMVELILKKGAPLSPSDASDSL